MAGFLRRWFVNTQSAPIPAVEDARAELDRLSEGRPTLAPLLGWLRELLPDLAPLESPPLVQLNAEQAQAKLADGIPLLRGEVIPIDLSAFRERLLRACDLLSRQQSDGAALAIATALRQGKLEPAAMIEGVLIGEPERIHALAETLELDPTLTATLLRFALFPVFTALAASLAELRSGMAWEQGYCPTCGYWPLLGEFRGLEQTRFLRCGLCADGWEVTRLWCSFCENRDHEQLGFLQVEGEESAYRVATCDVCRGYVKMVTTLTPLPPLQLLVADAVTLHLDLAASERGYLASG
jgi:FdhE protein